MACSPPGSSVCGILQASILEWVAMPSSRGSSRPRDQTCLLHCRQILYSSATREAQLNIDSHNICESMILFSKTKVLFRHEIGPHSSSLPCEYLSGVGDGNKKKRMLDLCENKDQRILPSKTQAVFSFVFCTHWQRVFITSSVPIIKPDEKSPTASVAVTLPEASPCSPLIFLKSSFIPDSKVQFWMWPAASKNKVILLGLSSEGGGWP